VPTTDLTIDPSRRGPLNAIWRYGANTCHAPLWFRPDLQRHLRLCRDRLGFTRLRAHGPVGDGMSTVRDDGSFDFTKLGDGLEILLDIGLTPFLEISHMPRRLARGDENITHYHFGAAPPKDWGEWRRFCDEMMRSLVDRFGRDELATWDFEVWNEPDLAFWAGTRDEYFRLYAETARAVKEADASFRIGGPATARCKWVGEFLDYCEAEKLPRDFVATHAYPSDLEFLDAAEGEVSLQSSDVMRKLFADVRRQMRERDADDLPIICGEWNSSAGPLAANHDECNNAPYIAKTLGELSDPFDDEFGPRGIAQGSLYWNLSDIYEECRFHYQPFHGGYGLLTVNDVAKSGFRAFEMLARHGGERIAVAGDLPAGVGVIATDEGDRLRLTAWHYQEPANDPQPTATLRLAEGMGRTALLRSVLPGQGSGYEPWLDAGRPQYATGELLDALHAASEPATRAIRSIDGRLSFDLPAGTLHQIEVPVG
jgi:xylan 1,4-beta-xylosidase